MPRPQFTLKTLLWLMAVAAVGCGKASDERSVNGTPATLPRISLFEQQPSDRFLVSFDDISGGHPFKGTRSGQPHAGAHIHFDNSRDRWPKRADEPATYPAVYAVADGMIRRVDHRFDLPGGNDRYGLDLAFAVDERRKTFQLCYSIEPMIPEPEKDFYRRFLLVAEGEKVRKGDVIAYMYIPPGVRDAHIHFHLRVDGRQDFLAPAIFTTDVARQFHAKWGDFGLDCGTRIPPCMGYLLGARENPFGSGPADHL